MNNTTTLSSFHPHDLELLAVQFRSVLDQQQEYQESLEVVKVCTTEPRYLIGGSVYRTLAGLLYGSPVSPCDFDFLVGGVVVEDIPDNWTVDFNRFQNPKLRRGNVSIDIVPLSRVRSIQVRGLAPTIEHYLSGTPLTVQSIAYDITTQTIVGDVGLHALQTKTVAMNHVAFAAYAAEKKGVTCEKMITAKAQSLGFQGLL